MLDMVKVKVKNESEIKIFVLMKGKKLNNPYILIQIYGNLLILIWQDVDHEYIFKKANMFDIVNVK